MENNSFMKKIGCIMYARSMEKKWMHGFTKLNILIKTKAKSLLKDELIQK